MLLKIILVIAAIDTLAFFVLAKIKNRNAAVIDENDPECFGDGGAEDFWKVRQHAKQEEKAQKREGMPRKSGKGLY